ncbi:MAG: response regulator [Chloroflexi bacterium]|nr:response regulator [Chloroflexota bacterium]
MSTPLRALIVEDSEDDVLTLIRQLNNGGYETCYKQVDTPDQMNKALDEETWDIIISDYNMPTFSAPAALKIFQKTNLDLPFIILSGAIGEDEAVASMKAGAHDYIMKGNVARLIPAIERELKDAEQRRENRLLEEQFLQTQKMESIGRLAGGVAHDFNNLLTSIMGHAQLGSMKLLAEKDPLREHFDEIQKAADSASNLTRQLLAFSRRQVIEPQTINLNTLIDNVNRMLHRLIGEHIELLTTPNPELDLVTVDPGQIEQVIVNLVINARDAIAQGGQITIKTDNVILGAHQASTYDNLAPGKYVTLSVSDNGTGMNQETQSKIFEPFFTTKDEGKGTGLGLATCYGIAKQNNGYIGVETQLGEGTTFSVYLPKSDAPGITQPTKPDNNGNPKMTGGKETILLAEDESDVRTFIASMLQDQGYNIIEASNGKEAIQIAEQHRQENIRLLITDIIMPQMDGIDLANQFKTFYPNTKVLLTSGYPDELITQETLTSKNYEFIQKPFLPARLSNKVREILDR